MNRYLVRQRFFKLTDHFDVKNEAGEVMFIVRSKLFTIGKKFWIDDTNGQEVEATSSQVSTGFFFAMDITQ